MNNRDHINNMLQAAFSDIFSAPQGATRKVYHGVLQRGATQRSGKIAKTLRDTANFARSLRRLVLDVSQDTPEPVPAEAEILLAPDEIGSYRGRRYY